MFMQLEHDLVFAAAGGPLADPPAAAWRRRGRRPRLPLPRPRAESLAPAHVEVQPETGWAA